MYVVDKGSGIAWQSAILRSLGTGLSPIGTLIISTSRFLIEKKRNWSSPSSSLEPPASGSNQDGPPADL